MTTEIGMASSRDLVLQLFAEWERLSTAADAMVQDTDAPGMDAVTAWRAAEPLLAQAHALEAEIIRTPAASAEGLLVKLYMTTRAIRFGEHAGIADFLDEVMRRAPADAMTLFREAP